MNRTRCLYLPSEVARTVLGYLQDEQLQRTFETFLDECRHLAEIRSCLQDFHNFPIKPYGLDLITIFNSHAELINNGKSLGCLSLSPTTVKHVSIRGTSPFVLCNPPIINDTHDVCIQTTVLDEPSSYKPFAESSSQWENKDYGAGLQMTLDVISVASECLDSADQIPPNHHVSSETQTDSSAISSNTYCQLDEGRCCSNESQTDLSLIWTNIDGAEVQFLSDKYSSLLNQLIGQHAQSLIGHQLCPACLQNPDTDSKAIQCSDELLQNLHHKSGFNRTNSINVFAYETLQSTCSIDGRSLLTCLSPIRNDLEQHIATEPGVQRICSCINDSSASHMSEVSSDNGISRLPVCAHAKPMLVVTPAKANVTSSQSSLHTISHVPELAINQGDCALENTFLQKKPVSDCTLSVSRLTTTVNASTQTYFSSRKKNASVRKLADTKPEEPALDLEYIAEMLSKNFGLAQKLADKINSILATDSGDQPRASVNSELIERVSEEAEAPSSQVASIQKRKISPYDLDEAVQSPLSAPLLGGSESTEKLAPALSLFNFDDALTDDFLNEIMNTVGLTPEKDAIKDCSLLTPGGMNLDSSINVLDNTIVAVSSLATTVTSVDVLVRPSCSNSVSVPTAPPPRKRSSTARPIVVRNLFKPIANNPMPRDPFPKRRRLSNRLILPRPQQETCPLCGEQSTSLSSHLWMVHNVATLAYDPQLGTCDPFSQPVIYEDGGSVAAVELASLTSAEQAAQYGESGALDGDNCEPMQTVVIRPVSSGQVLEDNSPSEVAGRLAEVLSSKPRRPTPTILRAKSPRSVQRRAPPAQQSQLAWNNLSLFGADAQSAAAADSARLVPDFGAADFGAHADLDHSTRLPTLSLGHSAALDNFDVDGFLNQIYDS